MKLTVENVDTTFRDCLLPDDDPRIKDLEHLTPKDALPEWLIGVSGLTLNVGFVREKIDAHREDIRSMLAELPSDFHAEDGGGMSFLNMCDDKDGNQWTGLHQNMEQLVLLGLATGFVSFALPRDMWGILSGGMPYICVNLVSPLSL